MRALAIWLAALLAMLPAAASAQGEPEFSIAPTLACLDAQEDLLLARECIGSGAVACMESHPSGYSTLGQGNCLYGEWQYWDDRLNASYRALRSESRQNDIDMDAANNAAVPSQADALRDMQRAWIAFRDATCEYERSLWGGGTGGGPASASCMMYMTAEQTLYLESMQGNQ